MKRLNFNHQRFPGKLSKSQVILLLLLGIVIMYTIFPPVNAGNQDPKITASKIVAPVIKKVFDNGLTLLIKPNPANEVISVKAFVRMGAIYESVSRRGLSKLMQSILVKGTATRSAKDIVFETESAGASIDAGLVDSGYGHVSLRTTSIGFERSLPVFLDILQHPSFPVIEFEKERQLMLQQLTTAYDHPATEAYLNFRTLFYGDHPVGIRQEEIAKIVTTFTRDDLADWYRKTYIPNNMVISIVGKINPQIIEKIFQDSLGDWSNGKSLESTSTAVPSSAEDRQTVKIRDSQALFMILGYPAPLLSSEDSPVMSVINYILGGDMGSRLFVELRDKKGLAYNISTDYYASIYPSHIYAFMATAPENYPAAKNGIIAEFKRLTDELVPAEELQTAKQALKGRFLMSHETNASQADYLGSYELLGVRYQHDQEYPELIDKVTAVEIQRVARKYFTHYSLSVLSPVKVD